MSPDLDQSVSIKRRDRDKIEDSEGDIQETEINPKTDHQIGCVHEDIVRCSSHDFRINQHHEDSYDRQNQICCRSCKRNHKFSFAGILIIERIDLYRFSSSEVSYKHHKESYRINVFQWIRRQSSL